MSQRIYALAKELKIDSKELVDLCAKAGVTGKGSALASLSDEEVVKVKAYLSAGGGAAPAASPAAPIRPTAPIPPSRPPQVMKPRPQPLPPRPQPVPPRQQTPPPQQPPAAQPEPPQPQVPQAEQPPQPPRAQPQPPKPTGNEPLRREDYVPPTGAGTGRPPSMLPRRSGGGDQPKRRDGDRPQRPAGPVIRFAPMPASQQPPAQEQKSQEPAPQKPDIKLPADAIRAGRTGAKPLQEHLRKHEARRKAEQEAATTSKPAKDRGGSKAPADPSAPLGLSSGRDRRRTSRVEGGDDGPAGKEADKDARGASKRRRGSGRRRDREDEDSGGSYRRQRPSRRQGVNTAAPRKSDVVVQLPATVRSFSEAIGVPARVVLGKLLGLGRMANINAEIDLELAELLAIELGVEVQFRAPVSLEQNLLTQLDQEDAPESLVGRPPVVTFLGHVDHGKTSLLDRVIGINVVSGESGGITQHIRAYRSEKDGRALAFVDTPGHEAFTEMRARGANVTDIAVLVIAADDGVMPQTEEAISHARAAGVPIVIALNKIDLPGVDIHRVYQQLAENELLPTEWGGETELIKTSALTGEGIDDLLDTLLTLAELHDYKANPDRPAVGTCLEAELHEGRGVVAKLLVQKGTLRVGDVIVCGAAYGRVKQMYDTLDPRKTYSEAPPSTPVNMTGLNIPPGAGDHFYVLQDISQAREIAESREVQQRQAALGGITTHVTLENLFDRLGTEEVATLNLILRADVRGSIEAIRKELSKLEHPEVQIKLLQATVGGITEADVHLADASDAVIIGFNVVPDEGARSLAEQRGVQVRRYEVIYKVTEDLRAALEGMLKPEEREKELGRALVLQLFTISRMGTIAGVRVLNGTIERNCRVRVIRENRVIGDYGLESLRREKDDAKEVREGYECGMKLAGFNDLKEGDILEAYKIEEVARTF